MRNAVLLVALVAVVACSKSAPIQASELERFERDLGRTFDGAYVGSAGVYVDRKLAVTAERLTVPGTLKAALASLPKRPEAFVFDVDGLPVAVARTVLRDLDGSTIELGHRDRRSDAESNAGVAYACTVELSTKPIAARRPMLSIDVLPDRTYVGVSIVNELSEAPHLGSDGTEPDWDKLETTLKQLKASELFAERSDAELAVDGALTSQVLVYAALVACKAGFSKLAIIHRDELTAKAIIPEIVDAAGLATAADVIAMLRGRWGKPAFDLRVGKRDICSRINIVARAKKPARPRPGTGYFVALVRKGGGGWIAMTQTMDPKQPRTTERTEHQLEASANTLAGELNNMRLFTYIEHVPLELAADDGVDAATFLDAMAGACDGRTVEFDVRAPSELSIKPPAGK